MIIFEWLAAAIYFVLWCPARLIFWLLTARDCKHCQYGKYECSIYDDWYECQRLNGHERDMNYYAMIAECRNSITRKYFKRKSGGKYWME